MNFDLHLSKIFSLVRKVCYTSLVLTMGVDEVEDMNIGDKVVKVTEIDNQNSQSI